MRISTLNACSLDDSTTLDRRINCGTCVSLEECTFISPLPFRSGNDDTSLDVHLGSMALHHLVD